MPRTPEQQHTRDRYQEWNNLVGEIKVILEPLAEKKGRGLALPVPAWTTVMSALKWDILHACMELEYADLRPPGFFCGLMDFYLGGHFPCGWGERRPDGTIQLFEPV